jgi:hypothetical protein
MNKPKMCRSCDARKVGNGAAYGDVVTARSLELCVPCSEQGSWDNTHSDFGHDAAGPEHTDKTQPEAGHSVAECWACHPELNPDYIAPEAEPEPEPTEPRKGTSRAGVVHCVRRTDTGRDKAKTVAAHISEALATKPTVRSYGKGTISVRIVSERGTVRLDWDADGHFLKSSKIDLGDRTRKVRNVSEAYRLLAITK